jgi:hypothetical protein
LLVRDSIVPSHNTDLSQMSTYRAHSPPVPDPTHSPPVPDPIVPSHNSDRSSQSKLYKVPNTVDTNYENSIKPESSDKVPNTVDTIYENPSKSKFSRNSSKPELHGTATTFPKSSITVREPATSRASLSQPRHNPAAEPPPSEQQT